MSQGSGIAVSCGVGRRQGLDPALLWLWHRLAATADSTPSLGTSICRESSPRNGKKRTEKTNKKKFKGIYVLNYTEATFIKQKLRFAKETQKETLTNRKI